MSWNDSINSGTVTANYNLTGLVPNTQYFVYNFSVLAYSLTTDSNGALNFTIDLSTTSRNIQVFIDISPPTYSLDSTNSTTVGTPVLHSLKWTDNVGLSGYIFSFDNCTGTLVNDTSWVSMTGATDWSNVTKTISSTEGCTIRWCVYTNDTSNNWNGTSCRNPFSYTTIPAYPLYPVYSLNQTNSTIAGTAIQHDIYWTAGNGLSGYVFSFCNGTYGSATYYNWTSADQESNVKQFNTTSSTSTTYYTTYYNYSDTSNNKCYWAHETGNPTFPPTWTTGWGTANQCTYTNLVSDNAAYFDVTPGSNDDEDWIRFNFTVNETVANIQWIYLHWNGLNAYDSGEDGDCFVANFGTGAWQKACDMPTTDGNCVVNLTSSISNYIQGNQVAFRCMGSNIDAADPIRSDFVELWVEYSVTSTVPVTEVNSSWTTYDGIDGDDYQNVDKVGVILNVSNYNPSASNSTYDSNNRPYIEIGFKNGTSYVNGTYCQVNATAGNNLPNNTAQNCSVNVINSDILNAWKYQANRSVIIRGIFLDANATIFDEVNVTGVYGYVDGWNSTSSSCSDANAVLANDTWTSMTGTTNWSNVTKTITSQVGATIKWCVYANDTTDTWNGTSCLTPFSYLTIPNYAPTVSDIKESPTDPATYSPGATYQFNATVCDANGISTISQILFQWSTDDNITVTDFVAQNSTCMNYTVTKTDLAVQASTSYKWYVSDSSNAWGSLSDTYTISKLDPILGIAGVVNGTYPFSETVYTTSNDANALTVALVRNDTATSNNTAIIYPAGLWNFTAYTNGNENYTSASTAVWNNINRGDISINIWLNGTQNDDKTITYPSDANATCQINTSSQNTFYLYQNGTSKGSQSGQNIEYNADLVAQDYNFTCYYAQTQNYSAYTRTNFLTISKAIPAGSNTLAPSTTVTYPTQTTVSCSLTTGDSGTTLTLKRDTVTVSTGTNPSEVITLGYKAGEYSYTCDYPSTENYSATTLDTDTLTVNKGTINIYLTLNGTQGNKVYTYPQIVNATAWKDPTLNDEGTVSLLRNGTIIGDGQSFTEQIVLGNATYNYSATLGTANYSASNITNRFAFVNKGDVLVTIAGATGTITYETSQTPQCYRNATSAESPVVPTLWRNNVNKTTENSTATIYGYNATAYSFVCNTTSTQNYSASNQATSSLTVNKKAITLTLGGITGQTITYETPLTPYCAVATSMIETVPNCKLTRDGVDVTSTENNTPTIYGYKASAYNFIANATFSSNYSSSNATNTLTVNKKTPSPFLYVSTNGTYPVDITAYAYGTPSPVGNQITYKLWRNDTDYSAFNNTPVTQPAGRIVFKSNTSAVSSNYTVNDTGETLNLNISKGVTASTTYLNDSISDQYVEYGKGLNLTGVVNVSSLTVYLDLNATGFGNNYASGTGSKENITSTTNLGWAAPKNISYNFTVHFDVNQNYTASSDTLLFYVADSAKPLWQNQGTNDTDDQILQGEAINLTAQGYDQGALDWAWLSTNESGSWRNYTSIGNANWWNTSWQKRANITINNIQNPSNFTNFQILVKINYDSDMQANFSDLRFTWYNKTSGNEIAIFYWVENQTNSNSAFIWLNVPNITKSDYDTVYVYYKNTSIVGSQSNGTAVFDFFDDFSGASLDTNKWTANAVNTITYSISSGKLRITDATKSSSTYWIYDNTDTGSQHQAKFGIVNNVTIEWISTASDTVASYMGQVGLALVDSSNKIRSYLCHYDGSGTTLSLVRYWQYETTTGSEAASSGEVKSYKIIRNGTTVRFYINDTLKATGTLTGTPATLAVAVGAYGGYSFLDYVDLDNVKTRKFADPEPTYSIGSEESYVVPGEYNPLDMNDAFNTWTWSNFTWQNSSVAEGTVVGWKIYYNDTSNNTNATDVAAFTIKPSNVAPTMSDIKESPTDPATYSPGAIYQFNATVCDNDGITTISKILFEWSTNSSITNYDSINSTCREYYTTKTDLAANPSGYSYKWYANDSSNAWGTLPSTYTINRASRTADVTFDKSSSQTYGTALTTGCSISAASSDGTPKLYRNISGTDADITSTEKDVPIVLPADDWKYICNITTGVNYSTATATEYFTIDKGTPTTNMALTLDGSSSTPQTRTYPNATNIQSSETNTGDSMITYTLYENGSTISNGAKTLGVADYNFTYAVTSNQNYTIGQIERILIVNQNISTANLINLAINNTESNKVYTYPAVSNATGWYSSALTGQIMTFTLYRNTTSIGTSNPISDVLSLAAAAYNYTFYTAGNVNYSSARKHFNVTIGKGSTLTRLFLNGTESDRTDYSTYRIANFTVTLNTSGKTVKLDTNVTGWQIASGTTPLFNLTDLTTAGKYNITGYFEGDENYTSSSQTYYATFNPITFQVYCEAGGPYSSSSLVLVVGNSSWSDGETRKSTAKIDILKSSVLQSTQTVPTSNEGKYMVEFSGLATGSYVANVTATAGSDTANCSDTFEIQAGTTCESTKTVNITGYAIDYSTGQAIFSGTIYVTVKETGELFSNTFTNGYWTIDLSACLNSGSRYNLAVKIVGNDGRSSFAQIQITAP
jgi:hypothetical protein